MSLTSYRAAPPRVGVGVFWVTGVWVSWDPAGWPGGDRLSRCLSSSTMGAEVFHGRVRDGIGCVNLAMTTGPPGRILMLVNGVLCVCVGAAWCCVRCRLWATLRWVGMGVLSGD